MFIQVSNSTLNYQMSFSLLSELYALETSESKEELFTDPDSRYSLYNLYSFYSFSDELEREWCVGSHVVCGSRA